MGRAYDLDLHPEPKPHEPKHLMVLVIISAALLVTLMPSTESQHLPVLHKGPRAWQVSKLAYGLSRTKLWGQDMSEALPQISGSAHAMSHAGLPERLPTPSPLPQLLASLPLREPSHLSPLWCWCPAGPTAMVWTCCLVLSWAGLACAGPWTSSLWLPLDSLSWLGALCHVHNGLSGISLAFEGCPGERCVRPNLCETS